MLRPVKRSFITALYKQVSCRMLQEDIDATMIAEVSCDYQWAGIRIRHRFVHIHAIDLVFLEVYRIRV